MIIFPVFAYRSPVPDQEWESNRPSSRERDQEGSEERGGYDGPAGMDPDGLIDSNWDQVCENFDDMVLREELLRGIYAYGFEKPSAIQQRAIVPCVKGKMLAPFMFCLCKLYLDYFKCYLLFWVKKALHFDSLRILIKLKIILSFKTFDIMYESTESIFVLKGKIPSYNKDLLPICQSCMC